MQILHRNKGNILTLQFVFQYMRIEIKCDGHISKQTQDTFLIGERTE